MRGVSGGEASAEMLYDQRRGEVDGGIAMALGSRCRVFVIEGQSGVCHATSRGSRAGTRSGDGVSAERSGELCKDEKGL